MVVCVELALFPRQIGDSVFVHGGLRIKHVEYGLEKLNRETAAWLEGAPRFKVSLSASRGLTFRLNSLLVRQRVGPIP